MLSCPCSYILLLLWVSELLLLKRFTEHINVYKLPSLEINRNKSQFPDQGKHVDTNTQSASKRAILRTLMVSLNIQFNIQIKSLKVCVKSYQFICIFMRLLLFSNYKILQIVPLFLSWNVLIPHWILKEPSKQLTLISSTWKESWRFCSSVRISWKTASMLTLFFADVSM